MSMNIQQLYEAGLRTLKKETPGIRNLAVNAAHTRNAC